MCDDRVVLCECGYLSLFFERKRVRDADLYDGKPRWEFFCLFVCCFFLGGRRKLEPNEDRGDTCVFVKM